MFATYRFYKYTKSTPKPGNNAKKLFTVLGTLIAITVVAIILVILWYRFKGIYKQKQKQKKANEQKRNFSTTLSNNPQTSVPRYASSEMLDSIHSTQSTGGNKTQSQVLIAPASTPSIVYKNVDAVNGESIQDLDNSEIQQQSPPSASTNDKTIEIQETTEC